MAGKRWRKDVELFHEVRDRSASLTDKASESKAEFGEEEKDGINAALLWIMEMSAILHISTIELVIPA